MAAQPPEGIPPNLHSGSDTGSDDDNVTDADIEELLLEMEVLWWLILKSIQLNTFEE